MRHGWNTSLGQAHYFQELVPYLIASLLLIGIGTACGLLTAAYAPLLAVVVRQPFESFAKTLLGLPKLYLALFIFLNNTVKVLLVMILGVLWGVVPVLFLLINGYVIGILLNLSFHSHGLLRSFLAVAPHGFIEVPAVLLGTSIGLMIGAHTIRRSFGRQETTLGNDLRRALKFFLAIIVPLLLIAAFIEAFITASAVGR